ncbi:low molecular weight protein-tyrosine-phosphatase [Phaeobacter sp. HF9A]|uniref:low molecular weight protein-tyrosine-phosphatase n=1 Tax=Phaeobacter sp. HF9A TaxID=2721561 RepID=UPI00158DA51B|nr:low molecular weight protein-tyrosine-phosphatase [Phaeobacter sp. HF9A]
MTKLLFVCLGNICRSPAAEAIFRKLYPAAITDSAGTAGYHIGEPPYGPMQKTALIRGIDMADLRARQFSPADFSNFDLILVMDRQNLRDVEALRPKGAATAVELFAPMAAGFDMEEVPDPYYTRDFSGCLDLLEAAAEGLRQRLDLAQRDTG